ncbi:MAG: hypothetical protein CVT73_18455 [Alphaproteobacteria bacterium HGW-Alphaproteobacteria-12]|nr:MAG: hypothetical protein CVT73_18455 [Alphaproteobacteria bacterium HGW-Alphaproteobacteria-12]
MEELATVTVHVVDDDDAVRDSMCVLLESYGATVELYPSARAFLERVNMEDGGACLLLDLNMPGMSGIELLGELKKGGDVLPVIAMTGQCDASVRTKVTDAGALALLEKPIGEEELVSAIARAVAGIASY